MEDIIKTAMASVASLSDDDKVSLKGKAYTMVAQRVQAFRSAAGAQGQILAEIIEQTDQRVVVKASVSVWRDTDNNGRAGGWSLLAVDFAEEYRNQGPVNKTSALENCCTSAIGRALSAAGLSGGEYASSFEVDNAINHKPEAVPKKKAASKKKAKQEKADDTAVSKYEEALNKAMTEGHPLMEIADISNAELDAQLNRSTQPNEKALNEAKPPRKEDDLFVVATGMKDLMRMSTTVDGLRSFYRSNAKNLERMKTEWPDLHEDLVAEMKAYSEELSTTTTIKH